MIKINLAFILIFLLFSNNSLADDAASNEKPVSTSKAVEQIQKTLLFSDKELAKKKSKQVRSALVINRSGRKDDDEALLDILVVDPKIDNQNNQKQELAYNANMAGQYEVAVELYKQILKDDPKNHHAQFGLAASYHKLGQYGQAKNLYYQLLKHNWPDDKTRQELIGNLISVIVEESPNEAVYILAKLSTHNASSAYILAGAAMAYDKIKKYDQAILLLKRAVNIAPNQLVYKFNLAVIYDKIADYSSALKYYQQVVKNYVASQDLDNSIPIVQIRQRIQFIKEQL